MTTEKTALPRHKPQTIWLTGLSGAGKSTLAYALEQALTEAGLVCCVLDGDNVRRGLNRDLGFSPQDRRENIRRVAEVARLMNDAGLIVVTSFISPYRDGRQMARDIIGEERFCEVYLNADVAACEKRDPKVLYRKARSGELPDFTGISSPYEQPEHAGLTLDTGTASVEACLNSLLTFVLQITNTTLPEVSDDTH